MSQPLPVPRITRLRAGTKVVHRFGHAPDPWQWPPWEYVKATGRWDDPTSTYRVLYAGSTLYACLVEVLAQFRPDPLLAELYDELEPDDQDAGYVTVPAGAVSARWLADRLVGRARLTGRFVTIGAAETLSWVQWRHNALLRRHGVRDVDTAIVRMAEDRSFTQALSSLFYGYSDLNGPLDGIHFRSRWGDDLLMWAIFERTTTDPSETSPSLADTVYENVDLSDRAVSRTLRLHHLTLIP